MAMTSRDHSRYPYTYACDWIREAGLAGSRADASQWITRAAEFWGIPKEAMARQIADQYVEYWRRVESVWTSPRQASLTTGVTWTA